MVKNLPDNIGNTREVGLIPEPGRSPRGGNGKPLQYSCLKNSIDRGAWWAMVHEVAKSWTYTTECTYTHTAHTFSILEKVNKTVYKNYL